jgi:hypothetical protein
MHELARHTIHNSEMLAIAIETTSSIIEEQELFFKENSSALFEEKSSLSKAAALFQGTSKALRFQKTIFKCLYLRSKALEERLRNEINLVSLSLTLYD